MAHQKKILISLPDSLLEEVDNMVIKEHINRSELIRAAMKLYIREKNKVEMTTRMKKGYEEMAEINLEYARFCLDADNSLQRRYEEKLAECE